MVEMTVRLARPVEKGFTVRGATGEELVAALQKRGSAGTFRPNIGLSFAPGGDSVTIVQFTADPVILLPEWRAPSGADAALKKGWDKVVKLVRRHEMAHDRDFRRAVEDLAKRVRKAKTLTEAEFRQMVIEFRIQKMMDRNELHDKRLEADWRRIRKFLGA